MFSALTLNTPQLSREMNHNTSVTEEITRYTWEDKIHGEYVSFQEDNLPSSEIGYVQLRYELRVRNKPSYIQSFFRSLKATFTITLAALPLVLMGMALIYFDLRTRNLCSEWQAKNHTLSFDVKRIRLIGKGVETITAYISFPLFLAV